MSSYILILIKIDNKSYEIPIKVGGRTYKSLGFEELKQEPKTQSPQEFWETVLYDVRTAWQMWIPKMVEIPNQKIKLGDYFANKKDVEVVISKKGNRRKTIKIPIKKIKEWGGRGGKIIYFKGSEYETSKGKWGMPFLSMNWSQLDEMVRLGFMAMEEKYTLRRTLEKKRGKKKEATMRGMSGDINAINEKLRKIKKGETEIEIYKIDENGNLYALVDKALIPETKIKPSDFYLEELEYKTRKGIVHRKKQLVHKKGFTKKGFTRKEHWRKVGKIRRIKKEEFKEQLKEETLTPEQLLKEVNAPIGKTIGELALIPFNYYLQKIKESKSSEKEEFNEMELLFLKSGKFRKRTYLIKQK